MEMGAFAAFCSALEYRLVLDKSRQCEVSTLGLTILYSERQNWLKGLYVIICMNPFFFGYVLFQHDVKYETSSMSLGCLYKPGNDELNYFDAAGLWISL